MALHLYNNEEKSSILKGSAKNVASVKPAKTLRLTKYLQKAGTP